jgi:hypothetical protein
MVKEPRTEASGAGYRYTTFSDSVLHPNNYQYSAYIRIRPSVFSQTVIDPAEHR